MDADFDKLSRARLNNGATDRNPGLRGILPRRCLSATKTRIDLRFARFWDFPALSSDPLATIHGWCWGSFCADVGSGVKKGVHVPECPKMSRRRKMHLLERTPTASCLGFRGRSVDCGSRNVVKCRRMSVSEHDFLEQEPVYHRCGTGELSLSDNPWALFTNWGIERYLRLFDRLEKLDTHAARITMGPAILGRRFPRRMLSPLVKSLLQNRMKLRRHQDLRKVRRRP